MQVKIKPGQERKITNALKKRTAFIFYLVMFSMFEIFTQNEIPQLDTITLNNGLKVYFLQYGTDSVLNIRLVINGGKKDESPCEVGYSELIQRLLKQSLNEKQIATPEKENRMTCRIRNGKTQISGNCMKKDLDKKIELLSTAVARLSFTKDKMDKAIAGQLDKYTSEKIGPSALSAIYENLLVYGQKNALGRTYCQYLLDKMLPEDLRNFYSENYTPGRASLLICGNLNVWEAKRIIAKHFIKWRSLHKEKNSNDKDEPIPKINDREIAFIHNRNSKKCLLKWIQNAPSSRSPDHSAFLIACDLFSNYLSANLKEQQDKEDALKFKPVTHRSNYTEISCSVNHNRLAETVQLFDTALHHFSTLELTPDDLDSAIQNIKTKYFKAMTPEEALSFYDPLLYDFTARQNYLVSISSITTENIQQVIKKYFKSGTYKLLIVGDEHFASGQLEAVGKINKYRALDFETCDDACKEVVIIKYHCESCYRRGQCNVWRFDPKDKAAIKNARARTK